MPIPFIVRYSSKNLDREKGTGLSGALNETNVKPSLFYQTQEYLKMNGYLNDLLNQHYQVARINVLYF